MAKLTMVHQLEQYINDVGLSGVLLEIAGICDENAVDDVEGSIEWTETADELREIADDLSI